MVSEQLSTTDDGDVDTCGVESAEVDGVDEVVFTSGVIGTQELTDFERGAFQLESSM